MRKVRTFLASLLLLFPVVTYAGGHVLRVGPPTLGNGGSNPISLSAVDWQYVYVSKDSHEINLSISPGFFYGKRYKLSQNFYFGMGPGLVLGANGSGLGGYTAFGFEPSCSKSGGAWCFSGEFMQALGYTGEGLTAPSALRLGVSLWY